MVTDPLNAYYHLAPPFLNRFEKHTLDWEDVLDKNARQVLKEVTEWAKLICNEVEIYVGPNNNSENSFSLQHLFYGYHWQYISSIVAAEFGNIPNTNLRAIVEQCKKQLMFMLNPEGFVQILWNVVDPR